MRPYGWTAPLAFAYATGRPCFELCFGSLSCWNTQPLFNFNVWTDIWTLASRISGYLVESILPSTSTIFPVPSAATLPQSIMDPPPCFTVARVFTLFSPNIPSLVVAKRFFCICLMLNFVLRSFFQTTLPSRSLLLKVCVGSRSRAILSEIFFGHPDLALTSTVPFIFHFLIIFLTVEIGNSVFVAYSFLMEMDLLHFFFRGTHG